MNRAISYLNNSNLDLKQVESDKLFYGEWRYCAKVVLPEISVLRYMPGEDEMIELLDQRQDWRDSMWARSNKHYSGHYRRKITMQDKARLCQFRQFLLDNKVPYKFVVSSHQAWIYTNSQDLLQQIKDLDCVQSCELSCMNITRPRNTIVMRNPMHRYRTYLRPLKFNDIEKNNLRAFLSQQKDLRIGPSLTEWLEKPSWLRTQDHFFIDHNDTGYDLMLSLIKPNIIYRTKQILAK